MEDVKYRSLARYPILAVGLSMIGFILIKTGRDAVFFQKNGLYQLPLAYIWIALVAVPASMVHLNAIERWGARRARTGVFFVTALLFLLFVPFVDQAQRTAMGFMFILVPTLFAAVFAGAWLLTGDLLEGAGPATMRWAYSRIGAASMVGGILGGLFGKGLSLFFEPRVLVGAGAIILVVVGLVVCCVHRRHPVEAVRWPGDEDEGGKAVGSTSMFGLLMKQSEILRQPYILVLVGISGLATLAALYIDFQFYATAMISGNNNAQFFANFYIVLNSTSLFLQLVVAPRLQSRFGVGGALMLLPTALLGSAGIFSFATTLKARAVIKVTEGGLKSSIHRSMWEQVYLPIAREKREVAKVIIDGAFARISEGIGASVLYLWLSTASPGMAELNLTWMSWVIIFAVLLWIGLTWYLNRLGCADIDPVDPLIRLPDS